MVYSAISLFPCSRDIIPVPPLKNPSCYLPYDFHPGYPSKRRQPFLTPNASFPLDSTAVNPNHPNLNWHLETTLLPHLSSSSVDTRIKEKLPLLASVIIHDLSTGTYREAISLTRQNSQGEKSRA